MEDITHTDYAHAERVLKDFEIKNLGEHHDLHVQSDTLLLPDVFDNFRNMCLKLSKLDPARFLSVPSWINMASSFRKDQSKIISFN